VYELPDGAAVELQASGRLELQGTPYLAGATAPLSVGVGNATRQAGVPLADAVRMVTANPSRLLDLPMEAGHDSLRVGMTANLTVFTQTANASAVEIDRTIVAGHLVHGADAA
jgi:N-acetylglucosamine-6-phosphate deacetylase